jgi:hypothetical protein
MQICQPTIFYTSIRSDPTSKNQKMEIPLFFDIDRFDFQSVSSNFPAAQQRSSSQSTAVSSLAGMINAPAGVGGSAGLMSDFVPPFPYKASPFYPPAMAGGHFLQQQSRRSSLGTATRWSALFFKLFLLQTSNVLFCIDYFSSSCSASQTGTPSPQLSQQLALMSQQQQITPNFANLMRFGYLLITFFFIQRTFSIVTYSF